MINLFVRNRLYLIVTLLIIVYTMIIVCFFLMLLDPSEKSISDKFIHFGFFSLLSYIIYFTLSYQDKIWFLKKHRTAITILITLLVGASVEIIQLYMPTRSSNIFDMIANLCGASFTILIIKYSPEKIKKLKRIGI
jgi:VanZ family protein